MNKENTTAKDYNLEGEILTVLMKDHGLPMSKAYYSLLTDMEEVTEELLPVVETYTNKRVLEALEEERERITQALSDHQILSQDLMSSNIIIETNEALDIIQDK